MLAGAERYPLAGAARAGGFAVAPAVAAGLVCVPVLTVAAHLFLPAGDVWPHLVDTVLFRYVTNSAWLVLGVGFGTFVIGTGTAWLCSMCRFPGRAVLEWALLLPLALPTYAIAYSYAGMLDYAGPVQSGLREWFGWTRRDYWFPEIRSLGGAIAVMSLVLYPYVYLLARAAFLSQSVCVLEVSRTLGRGALPTFTGIAVPLARPALAGGVALALMEALSDFGTVDYYGVDTFTTGIYRIWFALGDAAAAAQLSGVLLIVVLVVLVGEQWSRRGARYHHTTGRYRSLPAWRLRGLRAGLALVACLTPLALGFLIPAGQLAAWTLANWRAHADPAFAALAGTSFLLAALTAMLALALALPAGYAMRLGAGPLARAAKRVAGLGYAVPGSVIAVGVLLPLAWLDNRVDGLARDWFGVSTGLLLTGGIAALIFAYLVRFFAVSMNAVDSAWARIATSMDDAARTLGATPGRALRRVHIPLLRGGLLTAALLVFVDVMKELPATLILRPFDVNTLAVRAYEMATDERLADAAPAALAIVAAGLIPVIALSRAITRSRA